MYSREEEERVENTLQEACILYEEADVAMRECSDRMATLKERKKEAWAQIAANKEKLAAMAVDRPRRRAG
jgi:hypothetical protein